MRTNEWTCDRCRQAIFKAEDGCVEWLIREEGGQVIGRGLHLVHRQPASPIGRCQHFPLGQSKVDGFWLHDLPFECFLGRNGLMRLLEFLADGALPKEEVLEMIKRLHIPGYEAARHHFKAAIADEVFEPNTREGYYPLVDIQATLEWMKGQACEVTW